VVEAREEAPSAEAAPEGEALKDGAPSQEASPGREAPKEGAPSQEVPPVEAPPEELPPEEAPPQEAPPQEAPPPAAVTPGEVAAAAEVLVAVRTRRQIAAAVVWNSMIALAVLLAVAAIALTVAGILGAEL
jgi:hypothetical protein